MNSRRSRFPILCCALVMMLITTAAHAQRERGLGFSPGFDADSLREDRPYQDEGRGEPGFVWTRGRYENHPGGLSRRGGWWDTDYPDAEANFLRGVQRYTNIDANTRHHRWVDLTDPALFEQIFLYMTMKRVPIGSPRSGPDFTAEEVESLREFMLRGGFVLLDDFWSEAHWQDFLVEIVKIFPDRELVELSTDHEIFHMFYDIERVAQVPGRMVTWNNRTFNLDDPSYPPSVHAILDDDGRVMLVANYNTDLGDGWEHTFDEYYPTDYSNEAYRLGINYLIYAYTH